MSSAGANARDLAAQLGPDRAAGAGDENALAARSPAIGLHVGLDLMASQEVLGGDVANGAEVHSCQQVINAGKHLDIEVGAARKVVDPDHQLGAGARNRDHDRRGAALRRDGRQVVDRPPNVDAAVAEVTFSPVVIEHADRFPGVGAISQHRVDELTGSVAGSDDEGRHSGRIGGDRVGLEEGVAPDCADPASDDERQRRGGNRGGSGAGSLAARR